MRNRRVSEFVMGRELTRRRLIQSAMGTVAAYGAGALFVACGGDDDDSDEPTATTVSTSGTTPTSAGSAPTALSTTESETASLEAAVTTTPTPLAEAQQTETVDDADRPVLSVGIPILPEQLDPHFSLANVRTLVTASMFDHLLRQDFTNGDAPGTGAEIVPMIAESWERIDELTLEFKLRDDVTFHDGVKLTSSDVKFSLERVLLDPSPEFARARGTLGTIASIEAVDAQTLRITTTAPDPLIERRLASWASWIIPQQYTEDVGVDGFNQDPIGSGPYRLVEFRPDESMIIESHDDYWEAVPPVSRIEFRVIPETAARVTALVNGEVDLITNVPPDQIEAIEGQDGIEVRSAPVANIRMLHYNTHHPVLEDRRLRQAMNLAIDRDLIVETLWSGRALVPASHQYPGYGALHNADRTLPFDPALARQLVEESNYAGETITITTPSDYYTLGEEVLLAVVQMWQEVGINGEASFVQLAEFWPPTAESMVIANSNTNELEDPDGWWSRWADNAEYQRLWMPTERFLELGEQARQSLDVDERFSAYQEVLDIWQAEAPGTELFIPYENYGIRQAIDWLPYSAYLLDFRADNLRLK